MNRIKSPQPERRMGIYKSLADVPDRYRLKNYSAEYEGRDVWNEYLNYRDKTSDLSKWYFKKARRAGRDWKSYLGEQGPHHALATPDDVEEWAQHLLDNRNLRTAYEIYWIQLEQLYSWLQHHPDHPHVYQPVLMAAAQGEASKKIWAKKIQAGDERRQQRKNE